MRRLVLTILAACSGSSATPDAVIAEHPVPRPIVRGAHGSAIDIVAITADGRAAVTQDAEGNTRLWSALDGSVEPLVIPMAAAVELAIVHDGDNFLIASLDHNGDLQLVRIAATGVELGRTAVDRDIAVERLAATTTELLALRADQTIAVIGADGLERGRLGTPAGERTTAVVTRNDHAVAIVERDGFSHARTLDLAALTWGPEHATFKPARDQFALSPDGEDLAVYTQSTEVLRIRLATGDSRVDCAHGVPLQMPLGFIDAHTLACTNGTQIQWFVDGKGKAVYVHALLQPEHVAFGGEIQISAEGLALGIAKRAGMQYLGYALTDPPKFLVPEVPATTKLPGRVYPTDPARAGGIAAIGIEELGGFDRVRVRAYARDGLALRDAYELAGEVLAVDRAGRVYLATGSELRAYVGPVNAFAIAASGRPIVAPAPDASEVLIAADDRISLATAAGSLRWTIPRRGVVDVGWVEGEPFARFGAGLAKLDHRSGALLDRVCGWQFGLRAQAPEHPANAASVCDAE